MPTGDDVQAWLDRYIEAWRTYDPELIGSLFTENATYTYEPWRDPVRGRDAIVADWLNEPDPPESWEASYRPMLVEGGKAVATGETRYADGKTYYNLFVLEFDEQGRCSSFVEWWMLHS